VSQVQHYHEELGTRALVAIHFLITDEHLVLEFCYVESDHVLLKSYTTLCLGLLCIKK
jgi:hypothetical protein